MLTMTLVKVQGYVDGRLGLAATAEAGGRNAQGRRWAPWIRWPTKDQNIRRSRGCRSQTERHEGLADEVVKAVLVRFLIAVAFKAPQVFAAQCVGEPSWSASTAINTWKGTPLCTLALHWCVQAALQSS